MIIELTILGSVLGVGYKSFAKQRKIYTQKLLEQQQVKTQQLKRNADAVPLEGKDISAADLSSAHNFTPLRKMAKSPKDLALLSVAVASSSIGYLAYHPLIYAAPPLVLYVARKKIFYAAKQLKKGKVEMETLVSISIISSILSQRYLIASLLGFTTGLGDYLSSLAVKDNKNQLVNFFQDMPKNVWLLNENGMEVSISLDEVRAGDILVVSAGEVIPADGEIIQGTAGIDEHRFTGESVPAEKSIGDPVYAMTLLLSGKIHLKIEKAGNETSAMQIINILNHTADYKSSTVLEAEALSRQMVHPAMLASLLTLPLMGLSSAVAVLIAHPKERLQVSAPLSLMIYLKYALQEGMLIKDGRSLELLSKVDTLVFDKTGTLTEDRPYVGTVHRFGDLDENAVIYYAAVAERKQSHPIAQAILDEAAQRGLTIEAPDQVECRLGYGIKVTLQQKTIHVGSLRFLQSEQVEVPDSAHQLQEDCRSHGHSLVMIGIDRKLVGALELLPRIRPEAAETIRALKAQNQIQHTYIVSGDHEAPTRELANELGIGHYFAQTLPQQKAELIEKLQQEGKFVCYIGDGINDAIAMKQAQVSISLSGASQLATDTAQIVLMDQGITHLPHVFELAQRYGTHMKRQLGMVLGPSAFGLGMVFIAGWGMGSLILLSIASVATTLGYAFIDGPKAKR